jgi:hypothetical protein
MPSTTSFHRSSSSSTTFYRLPSPSTAFHSPVMATLGMLLSLSSRMTCTSQRGLDNVCCIHSAPTPTKFLTYSNASLLPNCKEHPQPIKMVSRRKWKHCQIETLWGARAGYGLAFSIFFFALRSPPAHQYALGGHHPPFFPSSLPRVHKPTL